MYYLSNQFRQQFLQKSIWYVKSKLDFSVKEKTDPITLVVTGRNDNYGGNFSGRLKTTLDWNLSHFPESELVYIEWNQIKEKPSDCQWIEARYPNAFCYVVSNNIHKKITNNDKMHMMEYFAKNIGIRKAKHNWILLINADVLVGIDTIYKMKKLNPQYVYSTHYINIDWDGKSVSEETFRNKKNIRNVAYASLDLNGVVGNFILTHKKNWMNATGYDETLKNVRAGVDNNGLFQLLHLGLKPMVLGHHFHLNHEESIINGINPTHGTSKFNNIPYKNSTEWGLANYPLKIISERIWELLQPI